MADERVLEGLALRRKVAEVQDWRVEQTDKAWVVYDPSGDQCRVYLTDWYDIKSADEVWSQVLSEPDTGIPAYETGLNTIKDAAAMLTGGNQLVVYSPNPYGAKIEWQARVVGSDRFEAYHAEPATAAWNAVLRWKARKQEAGSVK